MDFMVLKTTPVAGTDLSEVTISLPDFTQATVTVPYKVAESKMLLPLVEKVLASRQATLDALSPVDE
jgi:hypothetical protein